MKVSILIPVCGTPFMCALQDANTQIKGKVMSSTGATDTVTISLFYHTY